MIFWVISAVFTSVAAIVLATPFMRVRQTRTGWSIMLFIAAGALLVYIALGRPELF